MDIGWDCITITFRYAGSSVIHLSCNKTITANSCRKCGLFRTDTTVDSQYEGIILYPNTATVSKEQLLEDIKNKLKK